MEYILLAILCCTLILVSILLVLLIRVQREQHALASAQQARDAALEGLSKDLSNALAVLQAQRNDLNALQQALKGDLSALRVEQNSTMQASLGTFASSLGSEQKRSASLMEERLTNFERSNTQKLEEIRLTMERRISAMQEDNGKRLSEMQAVVDEKLQKTLESRMSESFKQVSEQLEKVYVGLGEMRSVAQGVGDLKKVLTNVKQRGILGEIQLGAILEEILPHEQYETNVATKAGSRDVVEYAIKLPGDGGSPVYLPIDSKFPGDSYQALLDAREAASPEAVKAAQAQLVARIKMEAKDIRNKYIDPPHTTDFAILFLPFEGLYAEAVNLGLIEELAGSAYRINLTGPSTMAAFLNSLQMGFRTLAIQKRSGEVWQILGAVKTEFEKFGDVLEGSQRKLEQVHGDLDKLIGTRTKAIRRKLRDVEQVDGIIEAKLLDE